MSEVHIQVGRTDGYRYIGVQPPITDKQQELLKQAEYEVEGLPTRFKILTPHKGEPYSEIGISTETYGASQQADEGILEAAEKLAGVLRTAGNNVIVDEGFQPLGFGYYLFGGQAAKLG